MNPSNCFVTADGELWNAFYGKLERFEKGRWQTAAELPLDEGPSGPFKPLNQNGPPWLLLDVYLHVLWQLHHGAAGENPRMERVEMRNSDKSLRIEDAIPWSQGRFLFATDAGLRLYNPAGRRLSRINVPEPPQPATTLTTDSRGRLWLGCRTGGLWMIDPAANALESFDRVPLIGKSTVYDLAPDPHQKDGVIVALGSRGVAFVRAGQKP